MSVPEREPRNRIIAPWAVFSIEEKTIDNATEGVEEIRITCKVAGTFVGRKLPDFVRTSLGKDDINRQSRVKEVFITLTLRIICQAIVRDLPLAWQLLCRA